MTTIAQAVYDAIKSQDRPCTTDEVCQMVEYDNATVISAMHRLSGDGVLKVQRVFGQGILYSIKSGAKRPEDGRGRPRNPPEVA
jgi:predicted transcriptional regulator